jgi:exopolysaccharide biosynthesis WecB/TagA/CpsF family protein
MAMTTAHASPLATVAGWPINIANQGQAITAITDAAARGESFSVCTLNLDHLDKLKRDARFQQAYATARFVTADGAPVAFLASLQGHQIERTTGADLVIPLACAAATRGLPIYLFGTRPQVLTGASKVLASHAGRGLEIVGSASPAHNFNPEGPEADEALDAIAKSGARLCFVALGAPKQEIFAARGVARGVRCGFVSIGAGLDFLVGEQVRAPVFMRRVGLEWFWRLVSDPTRMARRYGRCAIVLAEIALVAPAKRALGRASS